MELEELTIKDLLAPPPLMPWRDFADWIRMQGQHDIVRGWIRNGYLPTEKVGKHVMVNVALLNKTLLERESF